MLLEYDPEALTYHVTVRGEEWDLDDSTNPMEAWNVFIKTLDQRMRFRIGNACETMGRDRVTGERKHGR
jgi:hypothetical protein